jgi:hypothetical protein
VTAADIPAMLAALTDLNKFKSTNSLKDENLLSFGDIDGSGTITNADINALIGLLRSGGGSADAVPEPNSIALLLLGLPLLASIARKIVGIADELAIQATRGPDRAATLQTCLRGLQSFRSDTRQALLAYARSGCRHASEPAETQRDD